MDAVQARLFGDDAIYARTPAGQREVVFDERKLSGLERRFLLMVNGNTPLRALLDLIGAEGNVAASIRRLVDLGLLDLKEQDRQ